MLVTISPPPRQERVTLKAGLLPRLSGRLLYLPVNAADLKSGGALELWRVESE
jgi:hypothetical protein